jgi:hypothetical protein
MQHINYCSHAEQLTFNCHKGGAYHGKVVYFVIFRCYFQKEGTLGWVNMGNDL